jgi:DNA processing protein
MSDDLTFLIALHSVPGMGQRALRRIVERFGTARRAVIEATEPELFTLPGISAEVVRGVLASRNRLPWAERATARLSEIGGRVVFLGQDQFPARLARLTVPPWALYTAGDMSCLSASCVAIIGSTKPSEKGRALAGEFARRLVRKDITIVSGMADGVDMAAHVGAIEAGGRTAFVLPAGILRFRTGTEFPPMMDLLHRAVALSECPPEQEWSPEAAVLRNRLIAALASAVIVIETTPDGGAMHTVRTAEELDIPVFAVRYSTAPPSASGNESVIARGATPLTRLADVEHVYRLLG